MDDDPGWGGPKQILLGMFVPQLAVHRQRQGGSVLLMLRTLTLTFVGALTLIWLVVYFLAGDTDQDASLSSTDASAIVAVVGVAMVALSTRVKRTLPCGDLGSLLAAYRTRFFVRLAMSEVAALVGFALLFITGSALPYLVGYVISVLGIYLAAPTQAHIEAEDERLAASGCPGALRTAFADQAAGAGTTSSS